MVRIILASVRVFVCRLGGRMILNGVEGLSKVDGNLLDGTEMSRNWAGKHSGGWAGLKWSWKNQRLG